MKKLLTTHGVRLLLAFLCIVAGFWNARADVTIWVYGTASPYVHTWTTGATTQKLTQSVTKDGKTWYYATFTGVNSMDFCFDTDGNWGNQSPNMNATSGDNYYYYTSSDSYGINITKIKGATSYVFLEINRTDWFITDANSYVYAWNGSGSNAGFPGVQVVKQGSYWDGSEYKNASSYFVGGVKGSRAVHLYTWTQTPTNLIVCRSNGSSDNKWNSVEETYATGAVYKSGDNWYKDGTQLTSVSFPTAADIVVADPDWYVLNNFGGSWKLNDASTKMTKSGSVYTWDYTFSTKTTGETYFVLADALDSGADTWSDDWKNNHRYAGSTNSNTTVTPSSSGVTTDVVKGAEGTFALPAGLQGKYTFSYNASTKKLTVTGAAPAIDPAYYLIGAFNSWNDKVKFSQSGTTFTLKYKFSGQFAIVNEQGKYLAAGDEAKTLTRTDNTVTLVDAVMEKNLNLEKELEYTLSIVNGKLTVTGFPDPEVYLHQWANNSNINNGTSTKMTLSGSTYSLTLDLNKDEYVLFTDYDTHEWKTNRFHPANETVLSGLTAANATANGTASENVDGGPVFKTYAKGNYTFTYNYDTKAWTAKVNSVIEPVYSVAGSDKGIFGGEWDASVTSTNMTKQANGTYAWTSGNFVYSGDIQLKVVQDHSFDVAYPAGNYVVNNGVKNNTYTLTVTFNPSTEAVTATLNLVSAAAEAYYLAGAFSNDDWKTRVAFEKQADGTWKLTRNFSGEFKVVDQNDNMLGGTTGDSHYTLHFDWRTVELGGEKALYVADANNYTLTITTTGGKKTLTVDGFPAPAIYFRTWTEGTSLQDGQSIALESSDGVTYTKTGVSLGKGDYFLFSPSQSGAWNDVTRYCYNGDNNFAIVSGTEYTSTEDGNKPYMTNSNSGAGKWNITFNRSTKKFTLTQTEVTLDPIYLLKWNQTGGTIANATSTGFSTSDNNTYTLNGVTIDRNSHFVLSTGTSNNWDTADGSRIAFGGSEDQELASGTAYSVAANGNKTFKTSQYGTWNFTYVKTTGKLTATLVTPAPFYLMAAATDWDTEGDKALMSTTDGGATYTKTITFSPKTTDALEFVITDGHGTWDAINDGHRIALEKAEVTAPSAAGTTTTLKVVADGNSAYLPAGLVGDYVFTYTPATKTLKIAGAAPLLDKAYYLVGAFSGDDWKTRVAFEKQADGTWTLTRNFSGEFKLQDENKNWLGHTGGYTFKTNYRSTEVDTENSTGDNFKLEEEREYTLTIDASGEKPVLTVTGWPVKDYYLIGEFNGWKKSDADYKFTANADGTYTLTKTLNGQFKVFEADGANGKYYSFDNSEVKTLTRDQNSGTLTLDKENLNLEDKLNYTFTINGETLTVTGFPANDWYLRGGFPGHDWNINEDWGRMSANADGTFTYKVTFSTLTSSETNFFLASDKSDSWDYINGVNGESHRYAAEETINPTPEGATTTAALTKGGNDWNLKLPKGLLGEYTFTYNGTTGRLTVAGAQPDPRDFIDLYMFGKLWSIDGKFNKLSNAVANGGFKLTSADATVYSASNVIFEAGAEFAFSGNIANDDNEGGWEYLHKAYYGPASTNDGEYIYAIKATDINKMLTLGGKGQNTSWWFRVDEAGTYNVQVTVNDEGVPQTVTLKKATSTDDKIVNVYLEKTSNISNPGLIAFELRNAKNSNNASGYDEPYTVTRLEDVTTSVDGIEWYHWTVNNPIADLLIYDGNDAKDRTKWLNDATDPALSNMLIRRAGSVYIKWDVNNGTNYVEDFTRMYYASAVKEAPETSVVKDGHYYVYFVNSPGWDYVNIYAWDENNTPVAGNWDGSRCTWVGTDNNGYGVYLYDFGLISDWQGRTPIKDLIFNCGLGQGQEAQTGDFEFHNGAVYDYTGVVSLGRELGAIIRGGVVDGPAYTIENDLLIVYYDAAEQAFYAKDLNRANSKSINEDEKRDYVFDITHFNAEKASTFLGEEIAAGQAVELLMKDRNRYDQSNWVKLTKADNFNDALPSGKTGFNPWSNPSGAVGQLIAGECVAGQLIDRTNPAIKVTQMIDSKTAYSYVPNDYITPHFNDNYSVKGEGDLFFVQPKANEYAHITWAVYAGDNKFYTPSNWAELTNNGTLINHANAYNLKGGFKVSTWDHVNGFNASTLIVGEAYQFNAIVKYKDAVVSGAPARSTKIAVDYNTEFDPETSIFELLPVEFDATTAVVTGIKDVNNDVAVKAVKSVKIYNTMGVEQREMQPGVNIIVTTFTDGSRSSQKVLK